MEKQTGDVLSGVEIGRGQRKETILPVTSQLFYIAFKSKILKSDYFFNMKLNYHGRKFKGITNSPNGQVSDETVFHYAQHDQTLTATYSGGSIHNGHMLGHVNEDNCLDFVYHHLDADGNQKNVICHSIPELLPDGRIRLHENWEWKYGGEGKGESVVEEIS